MFSPRGTRGHVIHNDDGEVEADPIEPGELFARMVTLENEAVQAPETSPARHELAAAQQRIQQLYPGDSAIQLCDGSHRHAHSGQAEVITDYAAEWTTWQWDQGCVEEGL